MFYIFFRIIIFELECTQVTISAGIFFPTILFIAAWAAHLHTQCLLLGRKKRGTGEWEGEQKEDSDLGALQISHRFNDRQMTEVNKCPLYQFGISGGISPFFIYLCLPTSVSTLGSLKWQWAWAVQRRNAADRAGAYWSWQFQGEFYYLLASWTLLLWDLCFHYLKWSVISPSFINLGTSLGREHSRVRLQPLIKRTLWEPLKTGNTDSWACLRERRICCLYSVTTL